MVAGKHARHGEVSPEDLFLLTSSLGDRLPDLTYFVEDEAVSRHRVSLPRLGQAQFFGSGRQLAHHFDDRSIWDEFCSCFDVPRAAHTRAAVRDLFTRFLSAYPDAPAAVHGYAICWRDRAVLGRWGLRLEGDVHRVHVADPRHPVTLGFHDSRLRLSVTPSRFDWLRPGGIALSSLGLLHSRERRHTVEGEVWLGDSYREELFPADPNWAEDLPPSLLEQDDVFALVLAGKRRLPVITPPERRMQEDDPVAGVGILNVLLLNAWRLYKKRTYFGTEYRIDELVLALHRPTRLVAYIATTNSRLYFGLHEAVERSAPANVIDRNHFGDSRLGLYLLARRGRPSGITWCVTPELSP